MLEPTDIGLDRLRQPINPPEIRAASPAEAANAVATLDASRLQELANRRGSRRLGAAQVPFFFGSDLGRAYLKSVGPRALAFGEPAENCPAVGVSFGAASVTAAAQEALSACAAQPDCGCRLAAAGDVLLAPIDSFDYARAVTATLRVGAREPALLVAEALPTEPVDGAVRLSPAEAAAGLARQTVALYAPNAPTAGPIGALRLSADGSASLIAEIDGAERRFEGRWRSEGRRRGWYARQVALRPADSDGPNDAPDDGVLLLIGYEPAELETRRDGLFAAAGRLL